MGVHGRTCQAPSQMRALDLRFALPLSWPLLSAALTLAGCGASGGDHSPGGGQAYPPPGDFGIVATAGSSTDTAPSDGPSGDQKSTACLQERTPWPNWDNAQTKGLPSPRAAFSKLDHEVQSPIRWLGLGDSTTGNESNSHIVLRMTIDPHDSSRIPVYVAQSQRDDSLPSGACPSYWELPIQLSLSSGDGAIAARDQPATLQVGAGGVSKLHAQIPRDQLSGSMQWLGGDSTATDNSAPTGPAAPQSVIVDAWLARGVLWAQLSAHHESGQRSLLGDATADDPRCKDGKRLRLGADHPLGKLSAQRVVQLLQSYPDYLLQWDGQPSQELRLAAVSPPQEVCVDISAQTGPSAAIDMPLRMTFVDDEKRRQLVMHPHIRAALDLRGPGAIALDLRYNAFSRPAESLQDFLVRHALTLNVENTAHSDIFELSLRLQNTDSNSLSGSIALLRYQQQGGCTPSDHSSTDSSQCDSLLGNILRSGTMTGSPAASKK